VQLDRSSGQSALRAGAAARTILVVLLCLAPLSAQAPADAWPQFRGSPPLHGTTNATLPPALKLLWTYDAGESIESSAAIAEGVVYVGSQSGDLHAVNLADGTLKWKYKASPDGIGESSPAVALGMVFIGDLAGIVHAVDAANGKAVWTFKTDGEVKSSPVVSGDKVLVGSYDSNLYALVARTGALVWKAKTEGYVHATPSIADGVAYVTGCDEILRGIRLTDGRQMVSVSSGAYTGASPAILAGRAYYGTYENEVLAVDLKTRRIIWRYRHPDRNFPFYSSAALAADE
jgi:eukaryotic-like serine/threonine-protein kinase